ncbi:hypothetical protein PHISP_00631 [Aspergillus sp. HF37]|nr:hypothetical protein PHISP_00631 [Aspergillus sp. HF37]
MDTVPERQARGPTHHRQESTNRPRKKKNSLNPLQKGIRDFITTDLPPSALSEHGLSPETLPSALPKRFTIYEPMLLLSPNALTAPPEWGALYAALDAQQRQTLHASIVRTFRSMGVTHLAINAPIASTDDYGEENRMRSPGGLVPLHGDFGVDPRQQDTAAPGPSDFQNARWVRTVQNKGIVQVWAPVYTMFSRGNITEKARILGQQGWFEGLDGESLGNQDMGDVAVVDMYAGIGYFVFSYLRRGVRRVWGWEINGWSVEGLRRGCLENGWGCRVVKVDSEGQVDGSVSGLVGSLDDSVRAVIFHGDNSHAAAVLGAIRQCMDSQGTWNSVRHVNLGLLPTSSPAWDNACRMVDPQKGGWVHVHENVDIRQIEQKREEIVTLLGALWRRTQGHRAPAEPVVACRHVEHVKTYAPGVMHCVFDVQLLFKGMEHGR